jgi:transcription-repair coupling factor (superfamily II helicase)
MGAPVLIPETYVADLGVRLGLYRRLAALVELAEIDSFAAEMVDRFGRLPAELENLLAIVALKHDCRRAGIEKLDAGPRGAVITFRENRFADPVSLVRFITTHAGTIKLRPDHKLVYQRDWVDAPRRIQGVRRMVQQLAQLARGAAANAAE